MKVFIITTSTGEKWEVCQGTYIVIEETKEKALTLLEMREGEQLVGINAIKSNTPRSICVQIPIVE